MNKKNQQPQKTVREQLQESHNMIEESVAFWEVQMDKIIQLMNDTGEYPDWHPNKEDIYHQLNLEMQFILNRLQKEEKEIDSLEERTNRILADKIFKKFKRVDGGKKEG